MSDATGVAEAMLGLPGFRVLAVDETPLEVVIQIETSADRVGCPACGVVATAHDRMPVECRDLAAFGRPARLVWALQIIIPRQSGAGAVRSPCVRPEPRARSPPRSFRDVF